MSRNKQTADRLESLHDIELESVHQRINGVEDKTDLIVIGLVIALAGMFILGVMVAK